MLEIHPLNRDPVALLDHIIDISCLPKSGPSLLLPLDPLGTTSSHALEWALHYVSGLFEGLIPHPEGIAPGTIRGMNADSLLF
ncbi:putative 39S ribosomal protein L24_ mitochondrial [Caligus rogercresseyi]|uniref:Putative 39S ribosomal protein L24_ mitochondrial n=1 Tax=Caligus rogercresseyi TaxID=217165 RepID=A0A7T8HG91_CALRO|nr:putative 39S ribosomal protein L24_ mitochondrial [Caligus rogercresseyi]